MSTKNLVLQVSIKPKNYVRPALLSQQCYDETMYETSNRKAQAYAKSVGADYYCITSPELQDVHPAFQRFALFTEKFDEYDSIMYADSDYMFASHAPSLFDLIETQPGDFFAVAEPEQDKYVQRARVRLKLPDSYAHFNSGFFVIKRSAINRHKSHAFDYMHAHAESRMRDQDALNEMFAHNDGTYNHLTRHWNGLLTSALPLFCTHYLATSKKNFSVEQQAIWDAKKLERYAAALNKGETPSSLSFGDWRVTYGRKNNGKTNV